MAKSTTSRPSLREAIRGAARILHGLYCILREDEGFAISVHRRSSKEPFKGYFFPDGNDGDVVNIDKKPSRDGGVETIITIRRKKPNGPNPELN